MCKRNIKYAHFQLESSTKPGFATVAAVRDGENYKYAVSLCSPIDNFSRQKGRRTARQKWEGELLFTKKGTKRAGKHIFCCGVLRDQPGTRNSVLAEIALQNVLRDLKLYGNPNRWYQSVTPDRIELKSKKRKTDGN